MTGIMPVLKTCAWRLSYSARCAAKPILYLTLYFETVLRIFEMIIETTPVSQEPLLEDQNRLDNVKKKKKKCG